MRLKHLRMLNYASTKCLKVIKFSKPETKISPKIQVEGDIPLDSFEGGPIPHPPSGGNPGVNGEKLSSP
jgi:hypothetical protein